MQYAKSFGAYVAATCSGKNVEFVTGLGADRVFDYTKEKWYEELKGEDFDVVYDTVGGSSESWDGSHQVLTSDGSYVTIWVEESDDEKLSVGKLLKVGKKYIYKKKLLSTQHTHTVIKTQRHCNTLTTHTHTLSRQNPETNHKQPQHTNDTHT